MERESMAEYADAAIEFGETLHGVLDAGFDSVGIHERVLGNVPWSDGDDNPRDPLDVWREMTARLRAALKSGGVV